MGLDLEELGLSIIPTYGKNRGKYHLGVWLEAAETTNLPFFMILDKDAEKEAKTYKKKLKEDKNLFLLKKGSLEDYYPEKIMLEGIEKIIGSNLTNEEKEKLKESPRGNSIKEFAKEKKLKVGYFKVELGKYVAKNLSLDDIDREIKGIIERIRTQLTH